MLVLWGQISVYNGGSCILRASHYTPILILIKKSILIQNHSFHGQLLGNMDDIVCSWMKHCVKTQILVTFLLSHEQTTNVCMCLITNSNRWTTRRSLWLVIDIKKLDRKYTLTSCLVMTNWSACVNASIEYTSLFNWVDYWVWTS